LPTPGFALEVAFGELAREALLTGAFEKPARLAAAGFRFDFPTLEDALRFELGRLRD
jgi:NAD dependent epimerase/dehydratase family enzyme